jgi:hypothetical protein
MNFMFRQPLRGFQPVCLPYPAQVARRAFRTLRSARGRLVRVPLGHGPSLHGLRRWLVMLFAGLSTFVRPLHRYYARVRLPGRVRVGIAACAFSDRTDRGIRPIASGISRLPCKAFVYMPWFLDSAGPVRHSRYRGAPCGLPTSVTGSATRGRRISELNSPACTPPVNASPPPYG